MMTVLQAGMQNNILASLTRLSDAELVGQLRSLIARERDVTAEVVARLAELDTRDLHLREGYTSLFVYCRDALGLSEWEAYNRIEVARAARRFPVILDMLASGAVNLTTVKLLASHLTPANHVARLAPRPDVPPSVRRLPAPRPASTTPPAPLVTSALTTPDPSSIPTPAPDEPVHALPIRPAVVEPLSPDRYKLQLTISGETLEKLRLAEDMLGHAIPSGDEAAVLDRALTGLLVELAKKKFSDTQKPRRSRGTRPGARYPSAKVQRAVWVRDLGRCAFVGAGGHRCNERRFVEFHHVDPYVLGGEATVDQIQLRCQRHNDYEGRLYFGKRRRARQLVPELVRLSATHSTS